MGVRLLLGVGHAGSGGYVPAGPLVNDSGAVFNQTSYFQDGLGGVAGTAAAFATTLVVLNTLGI